MNEPKSHDMVLYWWRSYEDEPDGFHVNYATWSFLLEALAGNIWKARLKKGDWIAWTLVKEIE